MKSIDELDAKPQSLAEFRHAATPLLDASIARSGPTIRQSDWRDELLKTGIRGKGGQMINFSRVEPLGGTRWLHADAETKGVKPERVVISFGPDYAPLETRQVEMAWEEARTLSSLTLNPTSVIGGCVDLTQLSYERRSKPGLHSGAFAHRRCQTAHFSA